jgi:hypothetical protein
MVVVAPFEPPGPMQFKLKLVVLTSAPVDTLPLTFCAPVQPPEAVQPVAFVALQLSVEGAPLAMLVGDAVNDTVGADSGVAASCEEHDARASDNTPVMADAARRLGDIPSARGGSINWIVFK